MKRQPYIYIVYDLIFNILAHTSFIILVTKFPVNL